MAAGDVRRTFDDESTIRRSVVEDFEMVSPKEFPELKFIGDGSEEEPALDSLSEECVEMTYEWYEQADPPLVTLLAEDLDDSETGVDVTVAESPYMFEGLVLLVDDERMLVTTKGTAAGVVTVTRGYDGTAAAVHVSGAQVAVVGRVHKEDGAAPKDSAKNPEGRYNYCHPFIYGFSVSEAEEAIARYGIMDRVERRTAEGNRYLYQMMTAQYLGGIRVKGADTAAYRAGGFTQFVEDALIIDAEEDSFTLTNHLYPILRGQAAYGMDKVSDTIFCGTWMREKLAAEAIEDKVVYNRNASERRGGIRVDTIETNWGELAIVYSPWVNTWYPNRLFLEKEGWTKCGPLKGKGLLRTELAKTGPQRNFQIYGIYTYEFRGKYSRAMVKNLSTTV